MPPKRKGGVKGGAAAAGPRRRAKRARGLLPVLDETADEKGALDAADDDVHERDAEGDVDADADGEADEERPEVAEAEAQEETEAAGLLIPTEDADAAHDGEDADGEDAEPEHAEQQPELEPAPAPVQKRGRGRPRKVKGSAGGGTVAGAPAPATATPPTRSSPRKTQTHKQQHVEDPESSDAPKPQRGRRPGRPRGRGRGSAGRRAASEKAAPEHHDGDDDADGEADGEAEDAAAPPLAEDPQSMTPEQHTEQTQPIHQSQLPPQPPQQHPQLPPAPPSHPPSFPPHIYPPYPSYPSHAPAYGYPYPTATSDGRPYLPLRPDAAQPPQPPQQPMFPGPPTPQTSFATTFSYDAAPQGNPFPQFGPTVYGVGPEGDDDDDDDEQQRQTSVPQGMGVQQPRKLATGKAGGRAGRGDHVACHFCRGRKLKCDGRRPTCGHCALRSLACAYDETVRRRGPGKKEKNARRAPRAGGTAATPAPPHDVVVPGIGAPQPPAPAPPPQHPAGPEDPTRVAPKRRRRPPPVTAMPSQTGVLRFEQDDGAKPASAAYGVESNERLGYYYAPEGGYTLAPAPGWYSRDGDGEGGEGQDGEAYTPEGEPGVGAGTGAPQGQPYGPPHEGTFAQWPAEPPGGQHM